MEHQERRTTDWIKAWLAYTYNSESPKLYHEWVAVSMIAAALKRKCFHIWEDRIYPNFYIVLVGPAGKARKGTAMVPGAKLLYELGVKMTAQATTREALIRHLNKSSDTFTGQGEVGKGEETHMFSALTVYSEEFTVFIGYNSLQLMADLSNWYDCKDHWTYDTKNKGTDSIDGVYVNLIGATTPELFQSNLPQDIVGGGLLSRTICVYEEDRGKVVIFPRRTQSNLELRTQLTLDFEEMLMMSGEFAFSTSFNDLYEKWYPTQEREVEFEDERLVAYITRRPTHLRKLCMINNASRGGNMIITEEDFTRSLDLLKRTEQKMAYTFAGMGKGDYADILNKIAVYVKIRKSVWYSELLRKFIREVDNVTLPIIVATLEKAKFISIQREAGNYSDYVINYLERKKEEKDGKENGRRSTGSTQGQKQDNNNSARGGKVSSREGGIPKFKA